MMLCFFDLQCTLPVSPITTHDPVCDLVSACTPETASTNTLTAMSLVPGLSTRPLSSLSLRYLSGLMSLSISSSLQQVTLVDRNATAGRQSGLAHFATYAIRATCLWWNHFDWDAVSLGEVSLSSNSPSVAGVLLCRSLPTTSVLPGRIHVSSALPHPGTKGRTSW
jgi:hypothetical protein